MPPGKSLAVLFKEVMKPEALSHWTRVGIEYLSQSLFYDDPMGLRGFRVPLDEYEPEAERAFAYAFGLQEPRELWSIPPRCPVDLCERTLMGHLLRSFSDLFREEPRIDASVACDFVHALKLCTASLGPPRVLELAQGSLDGTPLQRMRSGLLAEHPAERV